MKPAKRAARLAVFGVAAALAFPPNARAADKKREFDESGGFVDPRKRKLPRTHRFRVALSSNYIRLSAASDMEGNRTQFHYAPLMVDLGYQAQFAKYLMARIAFAFGGNIANSRNAMPLVILPKAYFGFQGKLFGLAATYGFMYPFPQIPEADDGHQDSLGQPVIDNNHVVGGEASFTTRVDRVALSLAVGGAAVNSQLQHYDLSGARWYPMLILGFGVYFDGGILRERRARERERQRTGGRLAGR